MRNIATALALSAAFIAAPSHAQSEMVEDAAEAVEGAAEAAASPSPPPVEIQLAPPVTTVPYVEKAPRERPPRLRNYRFISPADYPVAAWQADETGVVRYSVEVSADGKALSCQVTEGQELTRLAPATCNLVMERAEFRPALDAEKREIAGTYEGRQNWRKREPEMPQMSLIFQYTHDENGVSSDCKFLKMENLPEKMLKDIERDKERGRLCKGFGGGGGVPYRDANGVPIAKRVTVSMDVVLEEPAKAASE